MRRLLPLLCWSALACYGADGTTSVPTSTPVDTLRIVNGPLVLDGVAKSDFQIAGPGVLDVTEALFETRDGSRLRLPATVELRRFTGDSGVVLLATVTLTGAVRAGEYDLRVYAPTQVQTPSKVVARALRIARDWPLGGPGPGPTDGNGGAPGGSTFGRLRITLAASGADQPTTIEGYLDGDAFIPKRDGAYPVVSLAPGGSQELLLAPGSWNLHLTVPGNCTPSPFSLRDVTVAADSTTTVGVTLTCTAYGWIRTSLTLTGEAPQWPVSVSCTGGGGCSIASMESGQELRFKAAAGTYAVGILRMPGNCVSTGPNPVDVTVTPGDTLFVAFQVACNPYFGALRVAVRVTGRGPESVVDTQFLLHVAECMEGYECASTETEMTTAAPLTLPAAPGSHDLWLSDVAANCVVTSPTPLHADVVTGATTDVVLDVACE